MKKVLLFSFAAVAAMSAATTATDALAFNIFKPNTVCIINGYGEVPVGRWVAELNQLVEPYPGGSFYEACSYFVKWINYAPLRSSTNLFLDELVVPGFLDCECNSALNFPTLILLSRDPYLISSGFDKFNQKHIVCDLMLTTDGFGKANGVITFNTNFPYPIVVRDP
jgi:hypothetical protein